LDNNNDVSALIEDIIKAVATFEDNRMDYEYEDVEKLNKQYRGYLKAAKDERKAVLENKV
jgi:hypothetical protein